MQTENPDDFKSRCSLNQTSENSANIQNATNKYILIFFYTWRNISLFLNSQSN